MKKAFTLIEILVVVAIIAILATITTISVVGAKEKTQKAKVLSDIRESMKAVSACKTFGGEVSDPSCDGSGCTGHNPICNGASNGTSSDGVSLASGKWPAMPSDKFKVSVTSSGVEWRVEYNYIGITGNATENLLICRESGCQPDSKW